MPSHSERLVLRAALEENQFFSFLNVFETQSENWLIENPDPFDQAAPGSSCQTIRVISSDFCLRGEVTVKRETWRMGENRK